MWGTMFKNVLAILLTVIALLSGPESLNAAGGISVTEAYFYYSQNRNSKCRAGTLPYVKRICDGKRHCDIHATKEDVCKGSTPADRRDVDRFYIQWNCGGGSKEHDVPQGGNAILTC